MGLILRLLSWLLSRILRLITFPIVLLRRAFGGGNGATLTIKLRGSLVDAKASGGLPFGLGGLGDEGDSSLFEITRALKAAATDDGIAAALLSIRNFGGDYARLWELRRALDGFKASRKPLVVYADSFDISTYWLASVADRIYLTPAGAVDLLGVRGEVFFIKPLLERLSIKADFLRVGRFKSYPETFTESEMTPEMEESLGAVLEDVDATIRKDIAAARGLEPEAVAALIDTGTFTASEAKGAGLVDDLLYGEALKERIEAGGALGVPEVDPGEGAANASEERGERAEPEVEDTEPAAVTSLLGLRSYVRGRRRRAWLRHPLRPKPQIVILEAGGAIVEGGGRGLGGGRQSITREGLQESLRGLREDKHVKGIVLRVDSPGGSALVSDILWEEVRRAGEEKPLWVSMGSSAASGGYYISAPAARIYAAPTTITGSIGVVAGKFSGGALMERVGVMSQAIERGGRSGLYSPTRGFTEDERTHLSHQIRQMYDLFIEKVRAGRGLGEEETEAAAQGRIWSGKRAKELGLVDELGGLGDTLEALRQHLGDEAQSYGVSLYTQPSKGQLLRVLMGARMSKALGRAEAWGPLVSSGSRVLALLPWIRLR